MKVSSGLILIGFVMTCSAGHAGAACHDLKGRVHTTSLDSTRQLGTIEIDNGLMEMEGALLGQITSMNTATIPMTSSLNHTAVFPGKGALFTQGDSAQMVPVANDACTLGVTEQLNIVGGAGILSGATGAVTATGKVNLCTGDNKFFLSGTLCTDK